MDFIKVFSGGTASEAAGQINNFIERADNVVNAGKVNSFEVVSIQFMEVTKSHGQYDYQYKEVEGILHYRAPKGAEKTILEAQWVVLNQEV